MRGMREMKNDVRTWSLIWLVTYREERENCAYLDPINFGILFSQLMKMMLYYYILEYKCTFMFKTLCNWVIPWDPHFNNYHFGPHKICKLFSLLSISDRTNEGPSPHVIFHFPHSSHLLLLPPLSLPLSKFLHGSSNQAWSSKIFEESRQGRLGD